MRNALTPIELLKTGLDPGEEHEAFDGFVYTCVGRKVAQRVDDAVAGQLSGHTRDCSAGGTPRVATEVHPMRTRSVARCSVLESPRGEMAQAGLQALAP